MCKYLFYFIFIFIIFIFIILFYFLYIIYFLFYFYKLLFIFYFIFYVIRKIKLNDLWCFSIEENKWTKIWEEFKEEKETTKHNKKIKKQKKNKKIKKTKKKTKNFPPKITSHCSVFHKGRVITFGGLISKEFYLKKKNSKKFSKFSEMETNFLYFFDLANRKWTLKKPTLENQEWPSPRYTHSCDSNFFYIYF